MPCYVAIDRLVCQTYVASKSKKCVRMGYPRLLRIIKAAKTPGTQPQQVRISTIKILPHPLSRTAIGGNTMANKTLKKLIVFFSKRSKKNGLFDLLQQHLLNNHKQVASLTKQALIGRKKPTFAHQRLIP